MVRLVFVFLIIFYLNLPNSSLALTIQLKNGSYLTGEIVSSDDEGFEVRCWHNDGTIKIKWEHLDKKESTRLKNILSVIPLNTISDERDGYKVYLRNGSIYEGILIEEAQSFIQIRTDSGVKNISSDEILRKEPIVINALKIYTTKEWYLEKLKCFDLNKALDNFLLAEYCRNVLKLYDKAKEHYYKSAQISEFYKEKAYQKVAEMGDEQIKSRISQIEKLLNNNDMKSLEEAKNIFLAMKNEVVKDNNLVIKISKIEEMIKEAEQSISSKSEREFNKKIILQYYKLLKVLIKQLCDQNITYADTISYVNTILYKQIITRLSKDNKISEEKVISIIQDRTPSILEELPQREVSYGDGSWIISSEEPESSFLSPEEYAKLQKKIKTINEARDKAAEQNQLIMPDTWWKNADLTKREKFIEALFAEKYLYVVGRKVKPCFLCSGEGLVGKNLCKQCRGNMVEITIVYK
jgi:hypothetical protein